MTPEQLQAALNALMGAGLEGDALAAATKALTDAFSDSVEAPDDEVVDAMPAAMRAAYDADDISADDKAAQLELGRAFFRAGKVSVLFSAAVAKAKNKDVPVAGFSLKQIEDAAAKGALSTMKSFGHQPKAPANPQGGSGKGAPTGFSAKIKAQEALGADRGKAVLLARAIDRKGFNEWVAAGRPD